MPLVRIDLPVGKSSGYGAQLAYRLPGTHRYFECSKDDLFQVISEHAKGPAV
jgi:hypothetical protein